MTDAEFMLEYVARENDCLCTRRQKAVLEVLEALAKMPCLDDEECGFDGTICRRCQALRKFRAAMEGK